MAEDKNFLIFTKRISHHGQAMMAGMKALFLPNVPNLLTLAVGMLATTSVFAIEPPPPAGRLLASQCFQCHSNAAGQNGGFESITGKDPAEIIKEMKEMKSKAVPEDIMERHAKGYTDEQIRQLAEYLATLASGEGEGDEHEEEDDD